MEIISAEVNKENKSGFIVLGIFLNKYSSEIFLCSLVLNNAIFYAFHNNINCH